LYKLIIKLLWTLDVSQ